MTLHLVKKAYDNSSKIDGNKYVDAARRELYNTLIATKKFKAL